VRHDPADARRTERTTCIACAVGPLGRPTDRPDRPAARSGRAKPQILTPFLFKIPVSGVTMPDVSPSDFAVVVYREDDVWEADVLPTALTENLDGLIQALRQQPGIGGTIGLAAVGDDFFVALRVLGNHVSVFLSDVTASVDWPLARQVLDHLDIPVPEDEDLDQVLPVGDMSIFDDLGVDEMELGALSGDLDLFPDEVLASLARRIGFGQAMERALASVIGAS
jgi:putative tRNA adenosine deaminase-associated protein